MLRLLQNSYVFAMTGVAAALFMCMTATEAGYTSVNNGDTIRLHNGPGDNPGGEFIAKTSGGVTLFSTFCVERNETFAGYNLDFQVASTTSGVSGLDTQRSDKNKQYTSTNAAGQQAIAGGLYHNTINSINYLTYGAAALYRAFAAGQYANAAGTFGFGTWGLNVTYDYGAGRAADATKLQQAIWYFGGQYSNTEATNIGAATNKYVVAVQNNITANGGLGSLVIAGVEIMNLTYTKDGVTKNQQSQMHYSGPDLSTEVPEPTSLAIFGMGIVGAVCYRRRRVSVAV